MYFELLGIFTFGFGIGYMFKSINTKTENKKLKRLKEWLQGEIYINGEDGKPLDEKIHHWEFGSNYIINKTIIKIDLFMIE